MVQVGGGFVGDDHGWVERQGTGDGDALLLPAGELPGPVVAAVAEFDVVEELLGPHARLAGAVSGGA